jgi:hypothetical protein
MLTSSINQDRIQQSLGVTASNAIYKYGFHITNESGQYGVYDVAQTILNRAYTYATESIQRLINVSGSSSFTYNELTSSVILAISRSYDVTLGDVEINSEKYRFDLL